MAALEYAKMGWHIFPIKPGNKKPPLTINGFKDATTDRKQIIKWWRKTPNANIGVATGQVSGFAVLDIDVDKKDGKDGFHTLTRLKLDGKELSETVCSKTPRGGQHLLYSINSSVKNRTNFEPSLDIRGDGGYIVLSPSAMLDGTKYEWINPPTLVEFADWPEWLPVGNEKALSAPRLETPRQRPQAASGDDLELRVRDYLASCEPAVQGQAGHDKLFWAAGRIANGFELSNERTIRCLLDYYNPRCDPPWDMSIAAEKKDFERKVKEAIANPLSKYPRGDLLNDTISMPASMFSDEDVARLAAAAKETIETITPPSESIIKIPDGKFEYVTQPPGLLGDICSWINTRALLKQPLLSLGAALVFCGALFGRKIMTQCNLRSNVYVMGIAKSSAGKNNPIEALRLLSHMSGVDNLIAGDDFTSAAAIESTLEETPSCAFLCDEIGFLLASTKDKNDSLRRTIVPALMKIYSSASSVYKSKRYADSEKFHKLIEPCCCVYGTSFPEKFIDGFTEEELHNGWLSRCISFFVEDEGIKDPDYSGVLTEPSSEMIKLIHNWYTREIGTEKTGFKAVAEPYATNGFGKPDTEKIIVPYVGEADAIFRNLWDEYKTKAGTEMENLWSKASQNAKKIALIVAAGCEFNKPVIDTSIAKYACELIRYELQCFEMLAPAIGSDKHHRLKMKILEFIKSSGISGATVANLGRKLPRTRKHERKEAREDLLEMGFIIMDKKGKEERFWTPENYLKYRKAKKK
jgi:hypothetical protein